MPNHQKDSAIFVGHLRAHSGLGCPLSHGNALADGAMHTAFLSLLDARDLAKWAHALHHLKAFTLHQMFKIYRDQARDIVKSCGGCATLLPVPHLRVNPRGHIPDELWQMDVTHFPSFGKLKYVHVTIDTYSGLIHESPLSAEASYDVIMHTLQCMAAMGKPQIIKTAMGQVIQEPSSNSFVPSLVSNMSLVFPTMLRARVSWNMPIRLLKICFSA